MPEKKPTEAVAAPLDLEEPAMNPSGLTAVTSWVFGTRLLEQLRVLLLGVEVVGRGLVDRDLDVAQHGLQVL
jgi:hypothetical protein